MLRLENMSCGYGQMRAVHGLNLEVRQGRTLALLGANGAGKTSTIMCVAGHVQVQEGSVYFNDQEITDFKPTQRIRLGIAVVPEGRRLFPNLSVKENLVVGGYTKPKSESESGMERVVSLFPRLGERMTQQAGSLSGGEQQMLSIGRALMSDPDLLLVDELSLGLMPKMIDICYNAIAELKKSGMTIVLVEQSTELALDVADDVCVLESGNTVWQGPASEAGDNPDMVDALLGLSHHQG